MATLALAAVGAAVGGSLLPAGIGILGTTLSGAAIGSQIGALAGRFVDQTLLAPSGPSRTLEGPRLSSLHVMSSSEGSPIPRVYGRARIGGQLIWATDLVEETVTSTGGGSAKGMGGSGATTTTIEYRYYGNFAVALCEGEIGGIGRVWANGEELDVAAIVMRVYRGSETQPVDSLIAAHAGNDAPAYRGVAYVVFEHLPLAAYGNRLPQLSFEVSRPVDSFNDSVRGVVMIPGSGEFAYATTPVSHLYGRGASRSENVHTRAAATDWSAALDQMQDALPAVGSVSLVVSWFGTDLRAGVCQLKPGVEQATAKTTRPFAWSVAGLTRDTAYAVSRRDDRPAYGGTPSDASVVEAIADLKARGLSVVFNPFVLMDVAEGNALPSPYGGASQPAYPWRGRITVHPAAGLAGSPDKTAAAATQVAAFVGTAAIGHFALSGQSVVYSGPAEWSYRRMILHNAFLAKAAGGVDAFLIGSELRGLSTVRSAAGTYPFVTALQALAADVKSVLGPTTKVLYAADWSEYFGHQPADGSGDVYFHLDPLWTSPSIDAIGIDAYWPLADWRDGLEHRDALAGVRSIYDLAYLRGNVAGGEGYDWYYASDADRDAQVRSPISDGRGKPWVFRYKDIKNWWLNRHYNRPNGVESATPTAWVPQSKPFWLMEVGCPAVDRGANQPNVFVDPKSSESSYPHYSRGNRDDFMQRRYLAALIAAFDPASPAYVSGSNPVSTVYGDRMVIPSRIHVYCWDARPYPAFPYDTETWGDGDNWRLGHWLTGRMAGCGLAETVAQLLEDGGFTGYDTGGLIGSVSGYVVDRIMSAREAIGPLALAYFFDAVESGGRISFRQRGSEPARADLAELDLVETRADAPLLTVTRSQETDLPASAKITYISGAGNYDAAVAEARRLTGASGRVAEAQVPVVMEPELASATAETWLFEAWACRERAAFSLPPSLVALDPGDSIRVTVNGRAREVRITEIADHGARDVQALALDRDIYTAPPAPSRSPRLAPAPDVGAPAVELLDLPALDEETPAMSGWLAAAQSPWPGGVAAYASPESTGFALRAIATAPAILGTTLNALGAGPASRLDYANRLRVEISGGQLASVSDVQMLGGRNKAAVKAASGAWEVLQFRDATLVAPSTYELSGLLRGQGGTEELAAVTVAAGASVVFLDSGLVRFDLRESEIGVPLAWRCGPSTRDIGDASYQTVTSTFKGRALKPFAPVHLTARRSSGGDIALSWVRRTRAGGDSWETLDVPLGETSEAYEVDILDAGGAVKRTLSATSPQVTYDAASQTADFGAPQAQVSVRVVQLSAAWGRGFAATALL